MKQVTLWLMIVYWFLHLLVGTGAIFSIFRLTGSQHPLLRKLIVYMSAMAVGTVLAIALVFLAKGVTLTWKFAIAWFVGEMIMDGLRLPLILYLVKGREKRESS